MWRTGLTGLLIAGAGLPVGALPSQADGTWTVGPFAGTGYSAPPTEGPATMSAVSVPSGLARDSGGNIYVADQASRRILKITPDGLLSFFAGNGVSGPAIAGPDALQTSLSYPYGVAVDSRDNVYIADSGNHRVLKVTQQGELSYFAGNGDDGIPAAGTATSESLEAPTGLAIGNNNDVYVTDLNANEVVKVTQGGIMTLVAGRGTGQSGPAVVGVATSSGLSGPRDLAVDADGNLYIADLLNHQVEMVSPQGELSIFAGSGSCGELLETHATSADLCLPVQVEVDRTTETVYIAENISNRVVKVQNGNLSYFAGDGVNGPPTSGSPGTSHMSNMWSMLAAPATVYVGDVVSHLVTKIAVTFVPGAPTVTAVDRGDGRLDVHWAAPGSDGAGAIFAYTVEATPSDGSPVTFGVPGNARSASVAGLTNGTRTSVRVAATNSEGTGPWSDPVTATPRTTPDAPTVTAAPDNQAIDVHWSLPPDGGARITKNLVTVTPVGAGAGPSVTVPTAPSTTSWRATGLENGRVYSIQVAAMNAAGTGPPSDPVQVTPRTVPTAPLNLSAAAHDGSVTLTFDVPAFNGGATISGYEYSTDRHTWTALATTGSGPLSATVSGLDNGHPYHFCVRAENVAGDGAGSQPATATPYTVPGPPAEATAVAGDAEAAVGWLPPTDDGGSPITGYSITATPDDESATILASAAPGDDSATVTGLANGVTYAIRVAAVNLAGTGQWSVPDSVTPVETTATVTSAVAPQAVHVGGPNVRMPVSVLLSRPRSALKVQLSPVDSDLKALDTTWHRSDATTEFGDQVVVRATDFPAWGAYRWTFTPAAPSTESTLSVSIRLHSLLGLQATRNGDRVTVGGSARVYNSLLDAYKPWAARPVTVQRWTSNGWATVVTLTTDASGNTGTVLRIPYRARFRLVTEDTPRYWGNASAAQDR